MTAAQLASGSRRLHFLSAIVTPGGGVAWLDDGETRDTLLNHAQQKYGSNNNKLASASACGAVRRDARILSAIIISSCHQ